MNLKIEQENLTNLKIREKIDFKEGKQASVAYDTFVIDLIFVSLMPQMGRKKRLRLKIWEIIKLKRDNSNEIHTKTYYKLKTSDTSKILESSAKERVPCWGENRIQMAADLSSETMSIRRKWHGNFKYWNKRAVIPEFYL